MGAYEGTILGFLIDEPSSTKVDISIQEPILPQAKQEPERTLYDNVPIPQNTEAVGLIDSLLRDRFNENVYGPRITEMELDALRHYYGMRSLAGSYGPGVANLMGQINEWSPADLVSSAAGGPEQSEVDLLNNAVALDHVKRGVGRDFHHNLNVDSLRNVLNHLTVPPKPAYMK